MKTKALYRLFNVVIFAALFVAASPGARAQNLFVADYQGGTIYEISPSGAQKVFASGLNYPQGLAFDGAGDLFEADGNSGNIYEFIYQDSVLNSNPVVFASGLAGPRILAFDEKGNLFVTDADNIYQFMPDGTESTFATNVFSGWGSLAVDEKGNLFTASMYSDEVDKFTPDGKETKFASSPALWGVTALTFKEDGELYAGNYNTNNVLLVKARNQKTFVSIYNPWGMVFDRFGNLYVTDGTVGNVVKISPKGQQETIASGLGDPVAIALQPELRQRR